MQQKNTDTNLMVHFRQMLPELTSRWSHCRGIKAATKTAEIHEGGHAEGAELNSCGCLILFLVLRGVLRAEQAHTCSLSTTTNGEVEQPSQVVRRFTR